MKYTQLTSEQRSQIFALLQKKTGRKEFAAIVGISQSTLSREIKRNSTPSGKYIWTKAVRKRLLPYKDCLKTITTDNGPEFAAHKDITKYLGVPVYFADPFCSWQKGAIEIQIN
ncbi:helix-turn-helix protein [Hallella colorans]|uniref:Helix-turn-helix protein n=1 Tax=Hallella colorans TaxID=1703337 RepID=A0A2U0TX51_9BACT|nr:helix-turn-helix domain-containing protein [Hallella colorans]PVX48174.1 helix-turn-helix protein [Hallella colorans]